MKNLTGKIHRNFKKKLDISIEFTLEKRFEQEAIRVVRKEIYYYLFEQTTSCLENELDSRLMDGRYE